MKEKIVTIEDAKSWTNKYLGLFDSNGLDYKTMVVESKTNEKISDILENCIDSARLMGFESVDSMYEDYNKRMIKLRNEIKQSNI